MAVRSGSAASRPLAALISQGVVAGSSLVLQFIAFKQLGASGLGSFSLLFGILITVNSMQSGWIGDSLTVLDRFEPGFRRALIHSQFAAVGLVFVVTTGLALPFGGIDQTTAILFGLASVAWVIEETMRRLLIARREFWKLVVNDVAFAVGSFGLVGVVIMSGTQFTLETLVLALFSGAIVAIGVGITQLPSIELSRGTLGASRMRELSSFAFWRAAQIGLRPGSQAVVRFIVVAAASRELLGQLELARLLLAPVLTAVSGAGVYLLPTYAAQAQQGARFRPAVPFAMLSVAGIAAAYGVAALATRGLLTDLFRIESGAVTIAALLSWTLYSVGYGAGIPPGNAMVATGRSRTAFNIRCLDAAIGIALASGIAIGASVDYVPAGLALGTAVGAVLLFRALHGPQASVTALPAPAGGGVVVEKYLGGPQAPVTTDVLDQQADTAPWIWAPAQAMLLTTATARWNAPRRLPEPMVPTGRSGRPTPTEDLPQRSRPTLQGRLLWIFPLMMIVSTEYKVRRRSIDAALSGTIDPLIAVELIIFGIMGAWALWRLAPTRPRLTPLLVTMWGYILTTSASALYSSFPLLGLARAVQLVIIGLVIHLLATEGTAKSIMKLLHGWIILMSVSILIGLAYVAPTTNAQIGRFTWLSVHSVTAGSMLAVSVCVLFGLWLQAGVRVVVGTPLPWSRNVYAFLLAFQLVFLLMTRTRGSIGGAFIALGIMAWVWSGNRMKPQLLLGGVIAGGALVLAFGQAILTFLTRGESADEIGTFNRRTEIWALAWESFLSRPLHGLGFTSAKGVFFDETGLGGAHNALINVMIDVGLLGLLWWTLMIGATIVVLNRQWAHHLVSPTSPGGAGTARADHLIMMGIFVATLINSVTTEGLGAGVNVSAIWWFVPIAWLTILSRPALRR